MSEPTKVVIEADTSGRLSIAAVDGFGVGGGYRMTGPKFTNGWGRTVVQHPLTAEDVAALRSYIALWEEIQARKTVGA